MNTIIDFTRKFKDKIVISFIDIRKEFPSFYSHRLAEWQRQGYIKKVIRGFYIFEDLKIDEFTSFVIANKIYDPSYISLESALRYYNFIPEQVFSVTSISTKKTKKFKTDTDIFAYRNLSSKLFFGYGIVKHNNHVFKIADPEKAILDYLYFHRHFKTEGDFVELRLNQEEIRKIIDKEKIQKYLLLYNNKTFVKTINKLLNYLYHD